MTGGISRREEKRRQTGQRIYETALELFRKRGFDAVTIAEIAERADVSVPTFYAHFASKEAMLMPVPTREEVEAVLATQPADRPPAERVRGAIFPWLEFVETQHREEILERWLIIARTPSLRIRTAEFERTTAAMVVDALPETGGPQDRPAVEVVVNALLSAYTNILLRWADEEGRRRLLDVADEVLGELRDVSSRPRDPSA